LTKSLSRNLDKNLFYNRKAQCYWEYVLAKTSVVLVVAFLVTAAAGTFLMEVGKANPYLYHEWVSPPAGSTPLAISMLSPNNNTTYKTNDVTLSFNITTQNTSIHYLLGAYYTTSWMSGNVTVYKQNMYSPEFPTSWSYSHTFQQMPDGEYSINITTWGGGGYAEGLTYNFFDMTTIAVINFAVDATPPAVSLNSIENKTYYNSDLPLNFATNENASLVSYVLDGQENVTVAGNVTLSDLLVGTHNLTVYVWDAAGNIGVSETASFTVAEPESFPTAQVAAVSIISVAAVTCSGSLLLIRRKRRKEAE
jgi:hypothetical protein